MWDDVVFQDRKKNNKSTGSWRIQEIKPGLCRRVKQESFFFFGEKYVLISEANSCIRLKKKTFLMFKKYHKDLW